MSLTPALTAALATDLPVGHWSPATRTFWETAMLAALLQPTPVVLRAMQRDFADGRWTAVTRQVVTTLVPTVSPAVLAQVEQDFSRGVFGAVTRQLLEGL